VTSLTDRIAVLSSITILRADRLETIRSPAAFVLVGGTCAGKSTIARSIVLEASLTDRCVLMPRHSTRRSRRGDEADSLTSVSWAEFQNNISAGMYALSWLRPMPDGSDIGYGCLHSSSERAEILVAGHGVYSNRASVRPVGVLDRALVIGVAASKETRARRLRERSPDIVQRGAGAVADLLQHDDAAMFANADIVVSNDRPHESRSASDVALAIAAVLDQLR
jgi:ribose 1,5-bisphosphokinase PhnN